MHVTSDQLVASLRSKGLRITASRRAICQVLAESHDEHLTAADLGARAEAELGKAVDQSTIYRTIEALEVAGHLHHVHFGHGPGVVHLVEEPEHHHIVCEVCGRTEDIPFTEVSRLLDGLEERYGFRGGSVHFALMGKCTTCDP